jgi:CheY-like chemotaxis protein
MKPATGPDKPKDVLLVEDSLSDISLTRQALKAGTATHQLHVVRDGQAALAFLRGEGRYALAPRPSLILLDLNLPKKDGREVLAEIKADHQLKIIPVCVLTTSEDQGDVLQAYQRHANCYLTKSMDVYQFMAKVRHNNDFWLKTVTLPPGE